MAELKTALEGEDMDAINEKAQTLSQAAMKIGEAVYKAQQAEAAEGDAAADGAGGDDGNVVDAEFEEVAEDDTDNDTEDSDQKAS
jgi:molecular chaperone DnaK